MLGPKIDDQQVIEHWADNLAEGLVVRMLDVRIAVFFAFEGQDKAMGETLIVLFFADVRASFKGYNLWNLLFQGLEGIFNFFDIRCFGSCFEFEGDNVVKFFDSVGIYNHA